MLKKRLDKCLVGQISILLYGWTNVQLDKCQVGQMSGWTNVWLDKCTGWTNVFSAKTLTTAFLVLGSVNNK